VKSLKQCCDATMAPAPAPSCPCCISMSMLHVHVHAACPCPHYMPMLKLHAHAVCPRSCYMFMLSMEVALASLTAPFLAPPALLRGLVSIQNGLGKNFEGPFKIMGGLKNFKVQPCMSPTWSFQLFHFWENLIW
jgi:hypothetical protein